MIDMLGMAKATCLDLLSGLQTRRMMRRPRRDRDIGVMVSRRDRDVSATSPRRDRDFKTTSRDVQAVTSH